MSDSTENRRPESMRFALFSGCTVAYKIPHLEAATRYVMAALDIDPVDLPFSCCPDPSGVHAYSAELWYTLAARNLALAEKHSLDIVTLCNGCYATLKHCRELLNSDSRLKKRINERLAIRRPPLYGGKPGFSFLPTALRAGRIRQAAAAGCQAAARS